MGAAREISFFPSVFFKLSDMALLVRHGVQRWPAVAERHAHVEFCDFVFFPTYVRRRRAEDST